MAKQFPDVAAQLGPTFRDIKTKIETRAKTFKDNAEKMLSTVYADLKLQDVVSKFNYFYCNITVYQVTIIIQTLILRLYRKKLESIAQR